MLEVFGEDFIELCKMKGLREKQIMFQHAMRNSLLPVATTSPLIMGWAVAGSVVIETVFSWPGLGRYVVDSLMARDYAAVQSCILIFAVVMALINLFVDLVYVILDPRIRVQ